MVKVFLLSEREISFSVVIRSKILRLPILFGLIPVYGSPGHGQDTVMGTQNESNRVGLRLCTTQVHL